ncbi:acyl-CoA dehydrogenase/oxidase C-terminal [Mytilinidion resinicola]|uniref:Acyl-CoA dehydrogenase/oxidase C-terminal n=1 Tax=Mytilinidion resinicola TaxID=574789 RepID=A0A6A6YVD8_9PEZI|nr:acyl-CoA dehydrogenase/oxidase C-terminal [Mytilinidion resinicola]KAF2812916.1 acyl-CoA dehydrogenase/oxidase C-terminal [Mytilinidion resinicola]
MAKTTSTLTPQPFKNEPATHATAPSSATDGFFQTPPRLENPFLEDEAYKRLFSFYLPKPLQTSLSTPIARFGALTLAPSTLSHVHNAESNPPRLVSHTPFGEPSNTLITSPGWQALQSLGLSEGIVAIAYEHEQGAYSRPHQYLKYILWQPSSAGVTCPSAMQDGAARLLSLHLASKDVERSETERRVFERAYKHLTARDAEAWTSGQWMTERQGGSDVRNTETLATYAPTFSPEESTVDTDGLPLGPWSISGFKWFSSATESNMTILLAKTPSGALSAFYAPTRRQAKAASTREHAPKTELNGITIHALKSKLGTRPLPTAELELNNTRAYLLGAPGTGIKTIATILNITRVHNSISALGLWARGLAISRGYARVRRVAGTLLAATPSHVAELAHQHTEFRGLAHLGFFCVALLGIAEAAAPGYCPSPPPPADPATSAAAAAERLGVAVEQAPLLLRLLTPVAKALTARAAIAGLAEGMESLGGVGYLENEDVGVNVARLFRDANVLSIWEGTTNVMAEDCVRVLKGRGGAGAVEAVSEWVGGRVELWEGRGGESVVRVWEGFKKIVEETSVEELKVSGREVLATLAWVVVAVLLGEDARRDGDAVTGEVARRWMARRIGVEKKDWREAVEWDRKIVFGEEKVGDRARL